MSYKMDWVGIGFIVLLCSLLLFMFVPLGVHIYNQHQNGPCIIITTSGEAEGGLIQHYFTGISYDLSYKGTYQRSGKECLTWVGVTKEEYERQMYGVKR